MTFDNTTPWNTRLKLIRVSRGQSQQEFAEFLDTAPRTYQRWELATNTPHTIHRKMLAEKLGIPESELFPNL